MTAHLGPVLAAYAAGDVSAGERGRVDEHLAACAPCRAELSDYRAVLARLATTEPAPPEVAWPRYRAELRARLARRASWRARWLRPVPIAVSAAVAAVVALVLVAVLPGYRAPADLGGIEYDGLAGRIELIDHYGVVERLDLLEDLDVIRNLDRLTSTRDG
jgi:predicted anti-sigma-YlaC factor YlaD